MYTLFYDRFIGEMVVGMQLGFIFQSALPEELIPELSFIHVLVPVAVATGNDRYLRYRY